MGLLLKLHRLVPPGRKALIVAMDQPRALHVAALAHPGRILQNLQSADVDGYLLTLATARHFEKDLAGRAVVISVSQDHQEPQQVVEQAVAFGASALKYEVYPYSDLEVTTMRCLEALAIHADRWNLPIMAEVVARGIRAGGGPHGSPTSACRSAERQRPVQTWPRSPLRAKEPLGSH